MTKTITLRLDEDVYEELKEAATADRRPLSNLIETAALARVREEQFIDDAEMAEILRAEFTTGPFSGVMHCFSSGRALADAALDIGFVVLGHGGFLCLLVFAQFLTIVCTPSPLSTRARLPFSRIEKTTIGMLLSRHSATALASITLRSSASTLP